MTAPLTFESVAAAALAPPVAAAVPAAASSPARASAPTHTSPLADTLLIKQTAFRIVRSSSEENIKHSMDTGVWAVSSGEELDLSLDYCTFTPLFVVFVLTSDLATVRGLAVMMEAPLSTTAAVSDLGQDEPSATQCWPDGKYYGYSFGVRWLFKETVVIPSGVLVIASGGADDGADRDRFMKRLDAAKLVSALWTHAPGVTLFNDDQKLYKASLSRFVTAYLGRSPQEAGNRAPKRKGFTRPKGGIFQSK